MGPKFNDKCLYKRKEREVCDTKTHGGEGHGKIEIDTGVTLPQEPRDAREPGKAGRVVGMCGIGGSCPRKQRTSPCACELQRQQRGYPARVWVGWGWERPPRRGTIWTDLTEN